MPTQIERLNAIREKHQERDRKLARLNCEKQSHEATLKSIDDKSMREFGVPASGLGDKILKTQEEAEKLLKEAEEKLGIVQKQS